MLYALYIVSHIDAINVRIRQARVDYRKYMRYDAPPTGHFRYALLPFVSRALAYFWLARVLTVVDVDVDEIWWRFIDPHDEDLSIHVAGAIAITPLKRNSGSLKSLLKFSPAVWIYKRRLLCEIIWYTLHRAL